MTAPPEYVLGRGQIHISDLVPGVCLVEAPMTLHADIGEDPWLKALSDLNAGLIRFRVVLEPRWYSWSDRKKQRRAKRRQKK
jgi:hypothetical protein